MEPGGLASASASTSASAYQHDPLEAGEDASLVRTCHLCGKATCGQRKGRVRCAYCKRIFCLQQLFKKFKIKASVEDKDFKCPRCQGICCCVSICQRPPPHVHCKVYKVRQNKKKPVTTQPVDLKQSRIPPPLTVKTEPPPIDSSLPSIQSFSPFPNPTLSAQDLYSDTMNDSVQQSYTFGSSGVPGCTLSIHAVKCSAT